MNKVLIAEDELTSRRAIARAVESSDFVAIQVSDGQRAWDILCDNPDISLLITDVVMPNMDGRELVEKIRKKNELDHLKIIIISGVVKLKDINEYLELGASRFMPKPVNIVELKDYLVKFND